MSKRGRLIAAIILIVAIMWAWFIITEVRADNMRRCGHTSCHNPSPNPGAPR